MQQSKYALDDLFAARARCPAGALRPGAAAHLRPDQLHLRPGRPGAVPTRDLLAATAAVLVEDAPDALNYDPSFAGLHAQVVARLRAQDVEAEDDGVLKSQKLPYML